jgi:hypothetical protein
MIGHGYDRRCHRDEACGDEQRYPPLRPLHEIILTHSRGQTKRAGSGRPFRSVNADVQFFTITVAPTWTRL